MAVVAIENERMAIFLIVTLCVIVSAFVLVFVFSSVAKLRKT